VGGWRRGGLRLAPSAAGTVHGNAEVYNAARAIVARHACGPALALRAAKRAIDDGLGIDLATGLEIERLNVAGLFATEDQRTGMRSFIENGLGKATFAGQ
jgi:enoyl-CoA hydratase/carnithine racemase